MLLALRSLSWGGHSIQVDGGAAAARSAAVLRDPAARLETVAALRADIPAPVESLAGTRLIYASASIRLEILASAATQSRPPGEFRSAAAGVEIIPSEHAAGTRPVLAAASLPIERLISLGAASRFAAERRLSLSADWIVRLDWLASYVYPRVATVAVSAVQRIEGVAPLDRLAAVDAISRIQDVPFMAVPTPVRLEPLRAGTTDTRGLNLASALAAEGDTIASITGISVARRDNRPIGTGDLSITPAGFAAPWIASGTTVNWWQGAGASIAAAAAIDYVISVSFLTTQGRPLIYDAYQLVTPALG